MDPATTLIVTAIALGAAAGLKDTTEQVVKDAYAGLKTLIQRKYAQVNLGLLEDSPESEIQRMAVGEVLNKAGATEDEGLLKQAIKVIQIIQAKAPETAASINLNLGEIDVATDIELGDIHAEGDLNVDIDKAKSSSGGFRLTGLRAGDTKEDDPEEDDPKV